MKISARQALEAFHESFVKQTSAPIAELISDDFVTLYENDEVLVGTHSVSAYGEESESKVMFFATVKGYGKISSWQVNRSFQ